MRVIFDAKFNFMKGYVDECLQVYPPPHDEGCVGEAHDAASNHDHDASCSSYGLSSDATGSYFLRILANGIAGSCKRYQK